MTNQVPIPIAVVGIGCRFPGGANSPQKLWQMLSEGRSGWSEVPHDRWNSNSFHHPSAEAKDGFDVHGGHFLDQDISVFEPSFFGISANEAESMDPQQRILLETTYEALENAGIPQEKIRGSDTGVYVGYFARDYDRMVFKDTSDLPKQHITGGGDAIVSNRISYVFDLKGPSMTIDTGCSGSLVALHLACQSLRAGESAMSIVGGVNLHLSPDYDVMMSFVNVLNKDGKCYAFDSRGSGYGRGEGSATIVLKRLDEALANGDSIRGVIRNTGINQDGKTNGISLPNKEAQKGLIRSVYQSSGLDPYDTGYVEAHGTGTVVGDQAEVDSIAELFTGYGKQDDEIFVGSVKTNLGHLEAASGLAGLIKTLLVLEKGLIPPNLNLQKEKEGLHLETRKIKVPLKLERWSKSGIRRASVNSYGYGGTNCHAILEAVPTANVNGFKVEVASKSSNGTLSNGFHTETVSVNGNGILSNGFHKETVQINSNKSLVPVRNNTLYKITDQTSKGAQLFVLTSKSQKSLPVIAENLRRVLASYPGDNAYLKDLAYTLSCRRSLLQWRCCVIATNHQELVAALDPTKLRIFKSNIDVRVFIFTGQGVQWPTMGRDLITRYSTFRESLDTSANILRVLGADWDLIDELTKDTSSRVNESEISQPVTTAIQVALVDLLAAFNIKPQEVLGHSSGEIGAAYAAGVLSHEAALTVSYRRGFVATACRRAVSGGGAMLAAGIGEDEINSYIERLRAGIVCVACMNSPSSTTISGDTAAIDELHAHLDEAGIFNRKLKVDVAYHSHHMRGFANQYLQSIEGLVAKNPSPGVKFFSSVTGKQKVSGFGAEYWMENLVSQVKFSIALEELSRSQHTGATFIEIGPHSALQGPIRQIMTQPNLESYKYSYFPTLLRNNDGVRTLLDLSKHLFESGCLINLGVINSLNDSKHRYAVVKDLAPYAWDHSVKYWRESRLSKDHRLRPHPYHDLLGLRIVSSTVNEPIWRHIINADRLPWLRDHVVDDSVIFPGSGYLCMAIEAIRQITQDRRVAGTVLNYIFKDVSFRKALIVPDSPGSVEMLLALTPSIKTVADRNSTMREEFRISSLAADGSWREHCNGLVSVEFDATNVDEVEGQRETHLSVIGEQEQLRDTEDNTPTVVNTVAMYEDLAANGNTYGPSFALVKQLRLGQHQGLATIEIPDVQAIMPSHFFQPHVIHPTTLDALMQIEVPLFNQHCGFGAVMPVFFEDLAISADIVNTPGSNLTAMTKVFPAGSKSLTFDSTVFQTRGDVQTAVVKLTHGELQRIGRPASTADQTSNLRMNYNIEWNQDVNFLTQETIQITPRETPENEVSPQQRMESLDRAASLYISECLNQIGAIDPAISKLHLLALFDWMKRYTASEDSKLLIDNISSSDKASLFAQLAALGAEGEMLSRLGGNLQSILQGKLDALSLMLDEDLLYRVYAENMSIQRCYLHMADYLKLLSVKEPFIRVLEIGAGTGSATVHILDVLSHEQGVWLDRYDFTDISSGFFEKAKPKFEKYAGYMEYKTLDIENDPAKQGFEIGTYDLVIASNVLHATSRIDATLSNVRKLLKPGGRLILVELTKLRPYLNITFGTLSGWWAGVEDGRKDCPLLSLDRWDKALAKNSFNGVEVAVNDYKGSAQTGALIVSKATSDLDSTILAPVEVICGSASTHLQAFAGELVSAFEKVGYPATAKTWPSQVQRDVIYIVIDDGAKPLLVHPSREQFYQIITLTTSADSVLWISAHEDASTKSNAETGLITGLARVARTENTEMKFVVVHIQQNIVEERDNVVSALSKLVRSTFGATPEGEKSTETEFLYRDSQLHIPRVLPNTAFDQWMDAGKEKKDMGSFHQPSRFLKLHVETPGLLDSLVFLNDDLVQEPIRPDEIEIETKAHGVNFKDVYIALGQMKPAERMTGESSGFVTRVGSDFETKFKVGDRVCGWGSLSPFATRSRVLGNCAYPLPDYMSFTSAASIPVVFLTAYIGLVRIAKLQKGQVVLIHAASGGVGQAAIMIAQHIGATIIATVGSISKSELLSGKYGIPKSHIFSSRLRTFKQGILRLTQGRGVDVVLNSLSGDYLHDTWAGIAPCGTFVEIGKADIVKRNQLSMAPFDKMVIFASLDLGVMKDYRSLELASAFAEVMSLFEKGLLKPVEPINVFNIGNIEEAFRFIQARKHRGKVVLSSGDDAMVKIMSARPPLRLKSDATFVIAGGLGDLGRRICHFLAQHGAKHIVTLSRRNLDAAVRRVFEEEIRAFGAEVHILACDVNDSERVQEIASECAATLPLVRGIIQAAMVLRDRALNKMEYDEFMTAFKPKFDGTRHLRQAFQNPNLENFIMLSSVAAILGNPGQGNYAAGCAYEDALANSQTESNTHFISLNLGLVEGSDIDTPERRAYLLAQGAAPVRMNELFSLLEYSLSSQAREDKCNQIISRLDRDSLSQRLGKLLKFPMLNHLQRATNTKDSRATATVSMDVAGFIGAAKAAEEVNDIVSNAIVSKISSLVALEAEDISMDVTMAEFGLDSLVAIELKNWIARNLQAQIQTIEILDMPSIRHLATTVIERSALVTKPVQAAAAEVQLEEVETANTISPNTRHPLTCCRAAKEVRKLPLHGLEQILQSYLLGIRHLVTDEEYTNSVEATEEFQQPGSPGQLLYSQLMKMKDDPAVENWMEDLYLQSMYLSRRSPTALYYDIMGTFGAVTVLHTQAERAAVISVTAFKFKQDLGANAVSPVCLNEMPLCMDSQDWLFNATRVPLPGSDEVVKYKDPEYDYLIVLRLGHFFKVPLTEGNRNSSIEQLRASFQSILDLELEDCWVGILTADERDSWATIRNKLVSLDPENEQAIRVIDGASFLICLDHVSPATPEDRIRNFMMDRGINRWHDKSLQFLIASNASTGFIGDHTKLDGGSVHQLLGSIKKAIFTYEPTGSACDNSPSLFEEVVFKTSPDIEFEIRRMRKTWLDQCADIDYANLEYTGFGATYLKDRRCNPQSGFEVVAQLASRMIFGRFEACWQPVNMAHYHKGRTEIIQTMTSTMSSFITSALASPPPRPDPALKTLFFAATREHSTSMALAQKGHGYHRTLTAMEMLAKQQGGKIPSLYSDLAWCKTGPENIMTGPRDGLFTEVASVWPKRESLFVNYEVGDDRARFSVVGHGGRAHEYCKLLEKAAGIVKSILDEE
ncbi:related to polyketide synthase [Phialocephala subalpina]|uniref:Related to polyketide synthase n=1 Tax=Phialocephala subalpina TaxID=576137 RepID=A0A1L7X771_9HELO|nr:related to polyketide synthase [Phialocephala subalpina]